ncbi:glycosyltransferase family 25 protein [Rhizobium sullae]|uniref:Glycosyl transferase family 25 n=1 Tax=Rhizobium sullae TaxID=50338 RepID=A0A4R3PX35_RHISU|nr:glycosyltransferase family 25 protein [Rhizobium sullae]TCU13183.1 glycosyl transferase family 25 [Rhizobium sullae]
MQGSQLKVVVVNLARSADRRQQMAAILSPLGIRFEFFQAIDGREGKHALFDRVDQRLAEVRRGFTLNGGEMGCFASHYLLWERCVRENTPLLIFEDDVAIDDSFMKAYSVTGERINRLGLIRFSGHKERAFTEYEKIDDGVKIVRFLKGPNGTSCYAVSPKAAKRLLAKASTWFEPVDLHLDRFWTHGVGSLGLFPYPVSHIANTAVQSEIWQGAQRAPKSRRFRKLRAIYRARDDVLRFLANLPYLLGTSKYLPAEVSQPIPERLEENS